MVDGDVALGAIFHALAHPARRDMLGRLSCVRLSVGDLAEPLDMSLAAAAKHVSVLERAGLLQRTVVGRKHMCRLDARPLATAAEWISHYQRHWSSRLDALDDLLTQGERR